MTTAAQPDKQITKTYPLTTAVLDPIDCLDTCVMDITGLLPGTAATLQLEAVNEYGVSAATSVLATATLPSTSCPEEPPVPTPTPTALLPAALDGGSLELRSAEPKKCEATCRGQTCDDFAGVTCGLLLASGSSVINTPLLMLAR